jgi:polyisoprenoid-binding protein YceI
MKRALLVVISALVVLVGGVIIWFYTSTNIEDPVEVTAPPVTQAPDTTVATSTGTGDDPAGNGGQNGTTGSVFELTDASTVTFELDEVLRGSPMTVVATNSEVAAQIALDPSDLSRTQIGTVVIGAQTFETDSSNRNRAIRGPILDSQQFPTITFAPTGIDGLSGSAVVGELLEFTVTGDLTIRDVTRSVTFAVSASLPDEATIEGTAESTVSREDFELSIPSVASVANVSDEVLLKIDFVASAG